MGLKLSKRDFDGAAGICDYEGNFEKDGDDTLASETGSDSFGTSDFLLFYYFGLLTAGIPEIPPNNDFYFYF